MQNTEWTTCGRTLLLNDHSFFIRGVNYAPTPIGSPGRLDMLGNKLIYTRDLHNLRKMNANAVKTYDFYDTINHIPFLDAAYNNGSHPIYTVFSIWIDQSLMESSISVTDKIFQKMVENYKNMALQTGGHPGIMGYSIGGEFNSITTIHDPDFWYKFNMLTNAVRQGLAFHNAKKIITTTFVDDGGESFTEGEHFKADVDLWGSNVYQTDYPGSVIPAFLRVPGNKPLLVSEYGYPYASNKGEGTQSQLKLIADLFIRQSIALERNYQCLDSIQNQILVGGFVFEYSDEWWKSGFIRNHDAGHTQNYGFPLGYLSEEYFGLFRIQKSNINQLLTKVDIVEPRPTVLKLTELWSKGPLIGEGTVIKDCKAHDGFHLDQYPNLAVNMEIEHDANHNSGQTSVLLILCITLFTFGLVYVIRPSRRRKYESLYKRTLQNEHHSYGTQDTSKFLKSSSSFETC